jgi:hypothetical protein
MEQASKVLEDFTTRDGLRAIVLDCRGSHLCGYVAIPEGHPLCGLGYSDPIPGICKDDLEGMEIGKRGPIPLILGAMREGEGVTPELFFDVHGSVTYMETGMKYPIKTDTPTMWIGFDCAHWQDTRETCTHEYVKSECESLAEQIVNLGKKG